MTDSHNLFDVFFAGSGCGTCKTRRDSFTTEVDESIYASYGAANSWDSPTVDDPISHPSHYMLPGGIEVIDITKHETFIRGNILKYVLRAPKKGNALQDMLKAREYLDMEIERLEDEEGLLF